MQEIGGYTMFDLFNKKSEKYIEKSLNKYNQILRDDISLIIRTKYKGRLYASDVEYLDNREVLFRCPIDKYQIIRFDNQSTIKVEFVGYSGLYTTKLLITEKIIEDNVLYYKGEIIAPIEKSQRRRNYRLPIVLDLNYTLLPRECVEYSGNTLDISVGGMLMETCEDIYNNKNLKIKIDIDGKIYNIKSTIIRKRTNFSNGTYLYNLKFDDLSNRHRNEISRFIFDSKNTHTTKLMWSTDSEKWVIYNSLTDNRLFFVIQIKSLHQSHQISYIINFLLFNIIWYVYSSIIFHMIYNLNIAFYIILIRQNKININRGGVIWLE